MAKHRSFSEDDRRFLVNLNLVNRDYVTKHSNIILSLGLSFTAIVIAGYSLYGTYIGSITYHATLLMLALLVPVDGFIIYKYVSMRISVRRFDRQYRKHFSALYNDIDGEIY